MKTAAIICEYDPLHLGHVRQFSLLRQVLGEDARIVCLMSGGFVQRGRPAVIDAPTRARAAVESGADLVLELPLTVSVSSAEGFAAGAVDVLDRLGVVDCLCFGCESGDGNKMMSTAEILHSDAFSKALHARLTEGQSFAATRQKALEDVGGDGSVLQNPNDILAVEYCKALLAGGSKIAPLAVRRSGSYHSTAPDPVNPSATALRALIPDPKWLDYVPDAARSLFADAKLHRIEYGERAVLARLRSMSEAEFDALPYGSEGLWRKLMTESRRADSLEAVISGVKSRRYARSRIERMILCAFLGIRATDLPVPAPYVRALAFNDAGRDILRSAGDRGSISVLPTGQRVEGRYYELEQRAARLYPLFLPPDELPEIPEKQRVFCAQPKEKI